MFDINKFSTEINNFGVLKSNRFIVDFPAPKTIQASSTDSISLRCENVQWPGASFATLESPPRAGYGATEVIPYAPIFEDVTMSFIVDRNSFVHKFFFLWMNSVVNMRSEGQSRYKDGAFLVGFKDDYCTDINIKLYKETGTSDDDWAMKATLYRAFPRTMQSFDLNWASNDDLVKLNIQFTYTDHYIKYKADE